MSQLRSLRREIAKKKADYVERLDKANQNNSDSIETENNENTDDNFDIVQLSDSYVEKDIPPKPDLSTQLKQIFLEYHVGRKLGDSLLKVLHENGVDVPNTTKKLLKVKHTPLVVRTVNPGNYYHFGLEKQLIKLNELAIDIDIIELDIGIDGLPLYKSSSVQLWPILGKIINLEVNCIFPIGIYCGSKKPVNINTFLHDFSYEYKELISRGVFINNKNVRVVVRAFICDAPARAFVTGCVGHNAFHGCSRCLQVGRKVENVTVYSAKPAEQRTDDMFKYRSCPQHHLAMFRNVPTDLENAGVNMVTQFPIDPMHLIDLGVTKKILKILIKKMNASDKLYMTRCLLSLVGFIPKEFGRSPRPIEDLDRWKATEFRQFLLYTGIVVLKDVIDDNTYYHFLLIHCAYRLLCCPYSYKNNLKSADVLLLDFVTYFPNVYGEKNLTYNVHNLLHVCECVNQMGLITSFTAYDFENFMQSIKKCVKKPNKILQQLRNNFESKSILVKNHEINCDKKKGKLIQLNGTSCYLSCRYPNNICLLKDGGSGNMGTIVKITRFENNVFYGVSIPNPENFYNEPIPSTQLGIALIRSLDSDNEFQLNINDIKCKMMCLPFRNKFVVLPILHNCV